MTERRRDITMPMDEAKMHEFAMPADKMNIQEDKVNHPSHYTTGEIEVINYIRDKLGADEFTGYCIGNVLKYVSRWRHKDGVQDLEKAQVYLNWAVESAKRETHATLYADGAPYVTTK